MEKRTPKGPRTAGDGKGVLACSLLQALWRPNVGSRGLSTRASSNSRANRSPLAHSAALSEGRHVRHSVSSWPSSTLFVPIGPRAGRSKAMNASAVALSTPHWQALARPAVSKRTLLTGHRGLSNWQDAQSRPASCNDEPCPLKLPTTRPYPSLQLSAPTDVARRYQP